MGKEQENTRFRKFHLCLSVGLGQRGVLGRVIGVEKDRLSTLSFQ